MLSKLHKSLTLDVLTEAAHRRMTTLDNPGFCTACGAEHDGIEPDAYNCECEVCGEECVQGAEELLLELATA